MTIAPVYAGIDVSKDTLDIFEAQTGSATIPNTLEAARAFAARLTRTGHFLVLEATGRYDGRLRRALEEADVPHARINPERARDFARPIGLKGTTDRIDGRMLAQFGERLQPPRRERASGEREAVSLLHRRRDQLVAMRVQEKKPPQRFGRRRDVRAHRASHRLARCGNRRHGSRHRSGDSGQ